MPYIPKEDRDRALEAPRSAGELNFAITKLITSYLSRPAMQPLSYAKINEVVGVLECAKAEFYRRVAMPYETKKWQENGDVYPEDLIYGKRTVRENVEDTTRRTMPPKESGRYQKIRVCYVSTTIHEDADHEPILNGCAIALAHGPYRVTRLWLDDKEFQSHELGGSHFRVEQGTEALRVWFNNFCLTSYNGFMPEIKVEVWYPANTSSQQAPKSSQPQVDVQHELVRELSKTEVQSGNDRLDALVGRTQSTKLVEELLAGHEIVEPDYSSAEFPRAPQNNTSRWKL